VVLLRGLDSLPEGMGDPDDHKIRFVAQKADQAVDEHAMIVNDQYPRGTDGGFVRGHIQLISRWGRDHQRGSPYASGSLLPVLDRTGDLMQMHQACGFSRTGTLPEENLNVAPRRMTAAGSVTLIRFSGKVTA
jgi:hypothetical protein